jgi:hypothetical protein
MLILSDLLVVVLESDLYVDIRVFCKAKKLPLESWSLLFGWLVVKIVRQLTIVTPDLVQVCIWHKQYNLQIVLFFLSCLSFLLFLSSRWSSSSTSFMIFWKQKINACYRPMKLNYNSNHSSMESFLHRIIPSSNHSFIESFLHRIIPSSNHSFIESFLHRWERL